MIVLKKRIIETFPSQLLESIFKRFREYDFHNKTEMKSELLATRQSFLKKKSKFW